MPPARVFDSDRSDRSPSLSWLQTRAGSDESEHLLRSREASPVAIGKSSRDIVRVFGADLAYDTAGAHRSACFERLVRAGGARWAFAACPRPCFAAARGH